MHCIFAILCGIGIAAGQFSPQDATISGILSGIYSEEVTCAEVVQSFLDRIEKYNKDGPKIGAIIATVPDALNRAANLDSEFVRTKRLAGTLHCVPFVVKDNIDVAGVATTNGLNAFASQVPAINADIVENAVRQGGIVIAKANMSPFADKEAWGHSETGGLIRNPFALDRTTYGSSGGNGAAGAAMFGLIGLGTETGVSVNLPSSAANLYGLRAPVADLSQEGVMPNSPFQDVVGPMTKRAEDLIIAYDAMKIDQSHSYLNPAVFDVNGLDGMVINIFEAFTYGTLDVPGKGKYKVDPEILDIFNQMVDNLQAAGATVQNKSVDMQVGMGAVMAMFQQTESPCMKDVRDGYFGNASRFGSDGSYKNVQEIVDAKVLPENYQKVWEKMVEESTNVSLCVEAKNNFLNARQNLINNFLTPLLEEADLAIWPAMPEFPPTLKPDAYLRNWRSEIDPPVNLILLGSWSAYPSLDVPMGFSGPRPNAPQGLPIGAFTITTPDKLAKLFRLGYAYQEKYSVTKLPNSVNDTMVKTEAAAGNGTCSLDPFSNKKMVVRTTVTVAK